MKNTQEATRRTLRILAILPGLAHTGISNKELAESLRTSPVNITRATKLLEEEGYAIRLENGLWGPSVKLLAMAVAFFQHTENIKRRADETAQQTVSRAHSYL